MEHIVVIQQALVSLGRRLREARLERNDTMAVFAERLGVSPNTVRHLERGEATVQIGTWLRALWVLDRLQEIDRVLESRESLIDRARAAKAPKRKRAFRRRRTRS